jgi:hypothetical protein
MGESEAGRSRRRHRTGRSVPHISLAWAAFNFGGSRSTYNHAKYLALASKRALDQTNPMVALQIYSSYHKLLTGKGKLLAAKAAVHFLFFVAGLARCFWTAQRLNRCGALSGKICYKSRDRFWQPFLSSEPRSREFERLDNLLRTVTRRRRLHRLGCNRMLAETKYSLNWCGTMSFAALGCGHTPE